MSKQRAKPTPRRIDNRPGLAEIATRRGTHSAFLESLTRGLADANRPGLSDLRTRAEGDFTLGLLDAWAAVCDTLEFHGERSANEAYLRTATERRSLRDHGRLIGYELAPAKAASVHLAFTAEAAEGEEETLEYPPGLQVRSIPQEGEVPQLFETVEPLTARASWNRMQPRMTYPQVLTAESDTVVVPSGEPRLDVGAPVVFLRGVTPVAYQDADKPGFLRRIVAIETMDDGARRADLAADPTGTPVYVYWAYPVVHGWQANIGVTTTTLQTAVAGANWSVASLSTAQVAVSALAPAPVSATMLSKAIGALKFTPPDPVEPALMQVVAGCFGNTAITRPSAPFDLADLETMASTGIAVPGQITATQADAGDNTPPSGHVFVYLDREFGEIVAGQTVLLRDAFKEGWSPVHSAETLSVEAYGLSAKVTRLEIDDTLTGPSGGVAASGFLTRRTTVFAAPRRLSLAPLRITADIGASAGDLGADQIELAAPELALFPGKAVAITGERADLDGVTGSEIRTIAGNTLNDGLSVLTFTQPLGHRYRRETVTLNANVAEATHGETVAEVLGDGDGATPFATYALRSGPLTHVSARTATGRAPALEVRVDGIAWDLVADFRAAGPQDRVYILRFDEDQRARIVFGDGRTGLRPGTGQDNITAVYRRGTGSEGMLDAGQLALLASKPQGLKGVSNPLPPAAAADAETLEEARDNVPRTVLTLGRVVSLRDYEDMARGFAGIAKARADWTFDGYRRPIYLTVAGQGGALLPEDGDDMTNLRETLRLSGEADLAVFVRNYRPAGFAVEARLFIDPAHAADSVIDAARTTLAAAFSFEARALGAGVSHAAVIAVLQSVAGVAGVTLDLLYRIGQKPARTPRLVAAVARHDPGGAVPVPAELLSIDMTATRLEAAT